MGPGVSVEMTPLQFFSMHSGRGSDDSFLLDTNKMLAAFIGTTELLPLRPRPDVIPRWVDFLRHI